jgi:heme A synthase
MVVDWCLFVFGNPFKILTIFLSIFITEVGVVEDLGQFKRLLHPGLHCIKWPLEGIVGRMSLRIQQLGEQI